MTGITHPPWAAGGSNLAMNLVPTPMRVQQAKLLATSEQRVQPQLVGGALLGMMVGPAHPLYRSESASGTATAQCHPRPERRPNVRNDHPK